MHDKNFSLRGTFTAIVTPFNSRGEVDFRCLKELVDLQIDGGVDGIVAVGTTGESPTLSMKEHDAVIEAVVKAVGGRAMTIAGSGGNSTSEAVALTKHAMSVGADATLQVAPYYNKPNQEGLYRHFSTVADLGLPVILYNVPGRTGREIAAGTVARLSERPEILAVKEASGDVNRVSMVHSLCDIDILCGDDAVAVPMISIGACGVISVASNVAPRAVSEMISLALAGDVAGACAAHKRLYPLFRDMFIDTNPIPVKAALAMMGLIDEVYRLPLCELDTTLRAKLSSTLRELGLLS